MNNVLKVNFGKRKKLTSLLGLSLDGRRLEGVVLKRTNGSLRQLQSFGVTLSLDPFNAAPELVGQEIRNHLDAADVRERHCVLGLPLQWALTANAELPKLTETDAASLLQLEAERALPSDPATLRLGDSRCPLREGRQYVTMAGIANPQLATLEAVLAAAKLKPVSFALRLAALQAPDRKESDGVLALTVGESHVGLQITCGGGIAAMRALEGTLETEAGQRVLHAEIVSREARITLGQLPGELREAVRRIRIFGPRDLAQQLAAELKLRFEPLGLVVEVVTTYAPTEFGVQLPADAVVSAAFSLAARWLGDQPPPFEFLPPKPTAWQQLTTKYATGKTRTASLAAAAVVLLVIAAFGYQQVQLFWLGSQWSKMATKVQELDGLQKQIGQYRPWFDDNFQSLSILKQVTTAFPEDGVVTAKTIDIRAGHEVSCSGNAKDQAAFLKMCAQLRAADYVRELKVDSIRGKTPMQFTFAFKWNEGGGHEN